MCKTTIFRNKQVQLILFFAAIFYVSAGAIIAISFTDMQMQSLTLFPNIFFVVSAAISFSLLLAEKEETKHCYYPLVFCDFLLMSCCFFYIVLTQIFVPGMKPRQARVQTGINTAVYTLYFAVSFVTIMIQKLYRRPIASAVDEQMPLMDQSQVWF